MFRSRLILQAVAERIARPRRAWRNRLWARRARLGGRPDLAETLPAPAFSGDADAGRALVAGRWRALGNEISAGRGSIWDAALPVPALEAARESCLWLDDLAALGDRAARARAQGWVQDWIRRYGAGGGRGWRPEIAGRRAERWAAHADLLTRGLDRRAKERFWRALAAHQRYLGRAWPDAPPGLPRLRALAGLIWSGRVLPHPGQRAAIAALGRHAEETIDAEGAMPSRAPEDLAASLILLIWCARMLEDQADQATPAQLTAIARGVPVLRALRLGDGALGRFHGGGPGAADQIDQALAELRLGMQPKPRLPMGYARLTGGRAVVLMDGAAPPGGLWAIGAHAGTLAFEMSVGRHPLVVNAGSGRSFGGGWADRARRTAAHSTVEVDGRSSARLATRGLAARTFGPRLADGPSLVSVRQAQDATGMWLLATHDGYVATHGLLHERRLFLDARGQEMRGEEILTVTDARARAQFDRAARAAGRTALAARFHLHPGIAADLDAVRQTAELLLPGGERWSFRAAGGTLDLEDSVYLDPAEAQPVPGKQLVVRAEIVEYLGQITWSFGRIAVAAVAIAAPQEA